MIVGNLNVSVAELGLAFDNSGSLWMVARDSQSLYRLNPATGAATAVGLLGISGFDSLAWDGQDLYALLPATDTVYRINRATGAASLVGRLGNVRLTAQSGLTADSNGNLWGLEEYGEIFQVDKSTGEATRASFTLGAGFECLALNVVLDFDRDGMPDSWENLYGLDPTDPSDAALDGDGDGLLNLDEHLAFTDPTNADTDGDGVSDFDEVFNPVVDPLNVDTDADLLSDVDEVDIHTTDPLDPDTDADGMQDGWEVEAGLDPLADDAALDGDADGLDNLEEFLLGTDPFDPDSDADGYTDRDEIDVHRTDPANDDIEGDGVPGPWQTPFDACGKRARC
jgi:hypothetical protein